jgi:hypothetical protein
MPWNQAHAPLLVKSFPMIQRTQSGSVDLITTKTIQTLNSTQCIHPIHFLWKTLNPTECTRIQFVGNPKFHRIPAMKVEMYYYYYLLIY